MKVYGCQHEYIRLYISGHIYQDERERERGVILANFISEIDAAVEPHS